MTISSFFLQICVLSVPRYTSAEKQPSPSQSFPVLQRQAKPCQVKPRLVASSIVSSQASLAKTSELLSESIDGQYIRVHTELMTVRQSGDQPGRHTRKGVRAKDEHSKSF